MVIEQEERIFRLELELINSEETVMKLKGKVTKMKNFISNGIMAMEAYDNGGMSDDSESVLPMIDEEIGEEEKDDP